MASVAVFAPMPTSEWFVSFSTADEYYVLLLTAMSTNLHVNTLCTQDDMLRSAQPTPSLYCIVQPHLWWKQVTHRCLYDHAAPKALPI